MSATFGKLGSVGEFYLRIFDEGRKVSLSMTSGEQTIAVEVDPQIAREIALSLLDAAKRVEDRSSLTVIKGGIRHLHDERALGQGLYGRKKF